jgi:hypothetical protein
MEPETRYAFLAALVVVVPGIAICICLPVAARMAWGPFYGEPVGILAGGLGMAFEYLVGERLVVRAAERAAEAEVRRMRLLAEVRHPTWTGALACTVARACIHLNRNLTAQAVVVLPFLAVLIVGISKGSLPLMFCTIAPAVVVAVAWSFVGLFLPRRAFEEDAGFREGLRSLKARSFFRLRYRGMVVAIAMPVGALAMLWAFSARNLIPH